MLLESLVLKVLNRFKAVRRKKRNTGFVRSMKCAQVCKKFVETKHDIISQFSPPIMHFLLLPVSMEVRGERKKERKRRMQEWHRRHLSPSISQTMPRFIVSIADSVAFCASELES